MTITQTTTLTHLEALLRPVRLRCGLAQPTPAAPFLLREKEPKAYQRGSILFDISSGGSLPHSHSVTLPLVYHRSFEHHWGDRRGQGNVLVSAEITLAVIAPENLAKLDSPLGVSRGGSAPFCWRSRNQEVPCESLVPFFSQERNCQCGRHEPTKAKIFLKLWFEVECIYRIWVSAPNNTFAKTKVSLCAEAEILQYTRVRNSVQLQAGLHQWCKGAQQRT